MNVVAAGSEDPRLFNGLLACHHCLAHRIAVADNRKPCAYRAAVE
jgi:hypothetical protein